MKSFAVYTRSHDNPAAAYHLDQFASHEMAQLIAEVNLGFGLVTRLLPINAGQQFPEWAELPE
jgi:hypothetical protein